MTEAKITKLPDEQILMTEGDILWEKIMIVDPRNYHISEWNARLVHQDRNMESLEDSILEIGIRQPLLSDEHFGIIDGHRRMLIAQRRSIMIPVIHRRYGEGLEADITRAVDSINANFPEPNTGVELGQIVNKLVGIGATVEDLATKLGIPKRGVTQWSAMIRESEELLPKDNRKAREQLEGLSARDRNIFSRAAKELPEEKDRLMILDTMAQVTTRQRDQIVKDIVAGSPVDLEGNILIAKKDIPTEQWVLYVNYAQSSKVWRPFMAARNWDKARVHHMLNTLMAERSTLRFCDLNQNHYDMYGFEYITGEDE